LPPEIAARFIACLEEVNGDYRVKDNRALIELIAEHGAAFPFLRELISVNLDAVVKHYEETGEVPPGIKLIRTATEEGSNVVSLEVLQGSRSTK